MRSKSDGCPQRWLLISRDQLVGTLRYEDGKARTGTAVDEGNFRGSRCVVKNKMLKMRIFSKDDDVNNLNFVKPIPFTEAVTSFRLQRDSKRDCVNLILLSFINDSGQRC